MEIVRLESYLLQEEKRNDAIIIGYECRGRFKTEIEYIDELLKHFSGLSQIRHIAIRIYLRKRKRYIKRILKRNKKRYQKEKVRLQLITRMRKEIFG